MSSQPPPLLPSPLAGEGAGMGDNGVAVDGFQVYNDNAHDYHHKHLLGEIFPIEDFISYEEIVERFEQDIKEYLL